jgi:transposase
LDTDPTFGVFFMGKYSAQFKRTAVRTYLEGDDGYRKVARRLSVDISLLRRWVATFKAHGDASPSRCGRRYTTAFKRSVLECMRSERMSYRQVAARFGIAQPSQVGIWERQYYSDGLGNPSASTVIRPVRMPKKSTTPLETLPSDDASRSREQLLAELEYLRMENAYLKKLEEIKAATSRRPPSGKKR